jgi:carbonic anhydrase
VPEIIFDAGLGELFVIRVAGNIADTSTVASVEYALLELRTKLILVMGHQNCGAVAAAIKGGNNGPNLNSLMHQLEPALQIAGEDATIDKVAMENAKLTVDKLRDRSAIINNALQNEGLEIVPAFYNFITGKVDFYDGLKA